MSALGLSGSNEDRQGPAEGWIEPPAKGRIDTPAEGWNSIVLIKTKPYNPLSYAPLNTYPWLIPTLLILYFWLFEVQKHPQMKTEWVLVNRRPHGNQDKANSLYHIHLWVCWFVFHQFMYAYHLCMSTVCVSMVCAMCMSTVSVFLPFVYVFRWRHTRTEAFTQMTNMHKQCT